MEDQLEDIRRQIERLQIKPPPNADTPIRNADNRPPPNHKDLVRPDPTPEYFSEDPPVARKIVESEGLCEICARVDLPQERDHKLSGRRGPEDDSLGFVDEILITEECAWCRLVSTALRRTWTKIPARALNGQRIQCHLAHRWDLFMARGMNPFGSNPTSRKADPRRWKWGFYVELDVINLEIPDDCKSDSFSAQIRLSHLDAEKVTGLGGVYMLGRVRETGQCDIQWMKVAYQECRTSHFKSPEGEGVDCEAARLFIQDNNYASTPIENAKTLRVIDVVDRCVIPAPPDCRYVILSYVWGTSSFLRLMKDNHSRLAAVRGLAENAVPKTILDVMALTKELGERYIWVSRK